MAQIMTEEQELLVEAIREFVWREVAPSVAERDRESRCELSDFQSAFEMGFHMLEIPEEYGGSGIDFQTGAMVFEELGKVDAGYAITLVSTFVAFRNVMLAGTKEQAELFADKIRDGGLGCFAITEPGAGSDAASIRTTAVRDGDEYVLNGQKCWITNGAIANVYLISAKTDPDAGAHGISTFLVEADREGVSAGEHEDKMGLRTSNTCDLILNDVRIPADHLVGKEGEGFKIAMSGLDVSRAFMATIAVGMMQRALDEAGKYSLQRQQFGKPIMEFQMVQDLLARMAAKTEACRALVQHTMRLIDNDYRVQKEGAITKQFVTDCLQEVASDAVQVMGGNGYTKQYPVEKIMRDAKIFQIMEGTNQIQSIVIARQLKKEYEKQI
ncbi:acyl-CoA dehydrogenase family protein [Actinobaculum sp. 352]|uniref:acyl-CoA dehydrogenase family protein n=1 Tax=Actinobaculum sp. 352 TaxID=2490946 RepID=UPI000F7E1162|nr:acyl-CoA dehydrogenase family protein [Actinobaculum sp. 352]RTE50747.1 acyl-CoA dehydrogenase [Actinobaculum sp. 352]